MNRHFFNCGITIMLLASCRSQERDFLGPPVFPDTTRVSVTPLHSDFLFDGSRSMTMTEMMDYVVISGYHENKYLHIFEKETGAYIKSFASNGRGPGEYLTSPAVQTNEDGTILYTYECYNGQNNFRSYKVTTILQNNNPLPFKEEPINLSLKKGEQYPGIADFFFAWQNKRMLFRNLNYRMEVQDTSGRTLFLYDDYPKWAKPSNVDSSALRSFYNTKSALNTNKLKCVIASWMGCIIEIFNISESGQMEKTMEKTYVPAIYSDLGFTSDYIDGKTFLGFRGVSVTDDYIYAQYCGIYYFEKNRDYSHHGQIAVFDWEGNPVRLYVLDWQIQSFLVDSQRNRCYLVGFDPIKEDVLYGFFDL